METHPSIEKAKAYLDLQFGRSSIEHHAVTGPFVTISRECGTGGNALGEELARRIDRLNTVDDAAWTVFDRNLVGQMLEDNHLSSSLARYLPEDKVSEVDASVGEIVGLHPSIWTLVHQTNNLMRRLARLGHVILVGRGGNFATEGSARGLHVRLVGSTERRAERIARLLGLTPEQALAYGRRVDHARRDYVRSFFEADIDDSGAYDLVLNMDRFSTESAADLLVAVLRSRDWIGAGSASCAGVLRAAAENVT
ncbi:MAG TPA: cytidylate kinase-like family protein [Opitutaceae bacterium]|nr:cytidylate kinase-like family protein [Opitutaceae bacterium]